MHRAPAVLAILLLGALLSSCGSTVGQAIGTQVPLRDVLSLQMLSARDGVGVAVLAPRVNDTGYAYLVRTNDGARSWRIAGSPLGTMELQNYSFILDFSSRNVGYLSGAGTYDVTDNGGASLTPLVLSGRRIAGGVASLFGSSLWLVVMGGCGGMNGGAYCNASLVTYQAGSATPSSDVPLPTATGVRLVNVGFYQYLLGHPSATAGVIVAAPIARRTIFTTSNAGASWTQATDPCPRWVVDGFVQPSAAHWIALCDLGPGSDLRAYRFMQTQDAGRSWSPTQTMAVSGAVTDGGYPVSSPELALSGNRKTIWLINDRGQMSSSSNWGRTWSRPVGSPKGGAWWPTTPFDTIPNSSIIYVPDPGVGIYRVAHGVVTLMEQR